MTDDQAPSAIPAAALSVMLIVGDADTAVAWYQRAVGARVLWNLGGVAGLEIGGAPFFVHQDHPGNATESSPDRAGVTSTRIELFSDDPDGVIARAIDQGARPAAPVADHAMPWGVHRQGGFIDPFGHAWSVGDRTPLHPWPPA